MSISTIIALVVAVLFVLKLFSARRSPGQLAEAAALIRSGGILVDVRTPAEFASGHADGAINVPLGSIPEHLSRIGPRDRAVVVHCASGTRSKAAVSQLQSAGYTNVIDVGTLDNARAMLSAKG